MSVAISLVLSNGGPQPPYVVHWHVERLHHRARVLAEALLPGHQAVAVVFVLDQTLGEVVGEPDVVMRREQQAGALPLEPLRDCGDLLRRGRLLGQ